MTFVNILIKTGGLKIHFPCFLKIYEGTFVNYLTQKLALTPPPSVTQNPTNNNHRRKRPTKKMYFQLEFFFNVLKWFCAVEETEYFFLKMADFTPNSTYFVKKFRPYLSFKLWTKYCLWIDNVDFSANR